MFTPEQKAALGAAIDRLLALPAPATFRARTAPTAAAPCPACLTVGEPCTGGTDGPR